MGTEVRAFARWQRLADLEEKYLRQKSNLHWQNVGDKYNWYFHKVAKVREVRNSIREVQNSDGVIVSSQEEIKLEVVQFLKDFLGHNVVDYVGKSWRIWIIF